jgi:iron complex outermembrane receptor protein
LFPTPIGSAERVEIVRGATPVVFGAGRIGGFLNFEPKAARTNGGKSYDRIEGSVAATIGSFDKFNVTGELVIPTTLGGQDGGLALYGEIEDSGSYYRRRDPRHELVQADFNQELGDGWSVAAGGMFYNSRGYLQTPGWNRLTQGLIDNGTYITGVDTDLSDTNGDGQLNIAEVDAVVGTFFGSSNIRTFVDFGVFGFPDTYALDSNVGTTVLEPRNVFLSDRDIADSESITLYADLIKQFDDGSAAKLQFFYDETDGMLNQTFGFAAIHEMDVFEVRGSYTRKFELTDALAIDLHATASHRSYDSRLREQFLSGYLVLDRRDLNVGPTANDIFATPLTDASIPWDSDFISNWTDTGASLLADIQLGELSLLVGGRYDRYDVETTDDGVTTFGAPTQAEASEGDFSYSASLSWRSRAGITPYITYAEGSEPLYNSNGGISPGPADLNSFLFGSELLELGLKFELLNRRLSGSLAYYDQTRLLIDPFQNVNEENAEGFEAEVRFLVSDNFTLTGAATFQEFNIAAPGSCGTGNGEFVVISPTNPAVNAFGQTITGAQGFGGLFAALNASCLPELQAGYERSIIPNTVLSGFATYTSDEFGPGVVLGGTIGATYVSETSGKTTSGVVLPDYTMFRAAAFAEFGNYSLTATVENLFDEEYFQPLQGVYEEVAALPGQGRTVRLTGKVKF